MRNQNLVPTQVTDKNGKKTTVFKKPASARTSSPIPAPTSPPKQTRPQLAKRIVESVGAKLSEEERWMLKWMLSDKYSIRTLRKINNLMSDDSSENEALKHGVAIQIRGRATEQALNETLFYYGELGIENYSRVAAFVAPLREYDLKRFRTNPDIMNLDEQTHREFLAFIKVVDALDRDDDLLDKPYGADHPLRLHMIINGQPAVTLKDPEIIALVREHAADADRIVAIIEKYRLTDFTSLRGALSGIHPSLAVGSL